MKRLILGGEASGKSDYALAVLLHSPGPSLFIATGRAKDIAFRKRINDHALDRPADLPVVEAGRELPAVLAESCADYAFILLDCLDFWLFDMMQTGCEEEACSELLESLQTCGADVTAVSLEVGMGASAADPFSGKYKRLLGRLNRQVSTVCDEAILVVAGRPLTLGPSATLPGTASGA